MVGTELVVVPRQGFLSIAWLSYSSLCNTRLASNLEISLLECMQYYWLANLFFLYKGDQRHSLSKNLRNTSV